MSSKHEHWYISTTGIFVGPYDSYEKAHLAATINFGYALWTITKVE